MPSSSTPHRFITIGELLLRLMPPDYQRLAQAHAFQAFYGGAEANVALALAGMGIDSAFFTAVPNHVLGRAALDTLRASGVDCSLCRLTAPHETPCHRLGTYYLEKGFSIRPSRVVYDRRHSVFADLDFSDMDWRQLLRGFTWLHLSGVTPALSPGCRAMTLRVLEAARELGLEVSFDGNFRSSLWSWEEARAFCTQCLPFVTLLLGIEPYHLWQDEAHPDRGDWKDGLPRHPEPMQQAAVFDQFARRYPNLTRMARHVRYPSSGAESAVRAYWWQDGQTLATEPVRFAVLDRVGAGDAFAAGAIYASMADWPADKAAAFAVACCAMKHTLHGDGGLGSVEDIWQAGRDIQR